MVMCRKFNFLLVFVVVLRRLRRFGKRPFDSLNGFISGLVGIQ